jgi:glycosyltransferase involved in cell wall biosynthesis
MLNKLPKVSVIIPVFNGEKTLTECLASVTQQDFLDYEIIVVNNNSTDNTKKIIDSFLNKTDKLVYVFESKQGRGSARNAGVDVARGEIIVMMDADCIAPLDWLSKIIQPILAGKELVVSGFQKDAIGNYWSNMRQEDDWRFIQSKIKDGYVDHLDTKNFAIKSSLLKKLRFNSQLPAYEDWDLFLRLKNEGIKIKFLPDLLVSHSHDSSLVELFKTQFHRGKSATDIFDFYRQDKNFQGLLKNDESASSFRLRNFLFFIPWATWQFIFKTKEAPYRVVADLAWKIGIIAAKISRK